MSARPRSHVSRHQASSHACRSHRSTRRRNLQVWHFQRSDAFYISHAIFLAQTGILCERKMHRTSLPKAATVWSRCTRKSKHSFITSHHILACNQHHSLHTKTRRARPTHPDKQDQACRPFQQYCSASSNSWPSECAKHLNRWFPTCMHSKVLKTWLFRDVKIGTIGNVSISRSLKFWNMKPENIPIIKFALWSVKRKT